MLNRLNQYAATLSIAVLAIIATAVPTYAQSLNTITVVNSSGIKIDTIQMSRTIDDSWGPDLLGNYTLPDGYSYHFTKYAGVYDIRLLDKDGDACVVDGVHVDEDLTWTLTPLELIGCELR